MIVFIEGPRHSGKTRLIDEFFKQNTDPNVIYYKFKFAKYIDELDMRDQETGPGVHYFSISNVLTILELNQQLLKDKTVIFDRSIFSAYVWSIYRKRMDKTRLLNEFKKILGSDLYEHCTLLYLTKKKEVEVVKRTKDYFGNFEDYSAEKEIFEEVLNETIEYSVNSKKQNQRIDFENRFDRESISDFCNLINSLTNRNASR